MYEPLQRQIVVSQFSNKNGITIITAIEEKMVHFLIFIVRQPPVGHGLLIHEVSRSHTTTYHSR